MHSQDQVSLLWLISTVAAGIFFAWFIYIIFKSQIEKYRIENILKEREARFSRFYSAVTEVIYRYDLRNSSFDLISPSFELLSGYSVDEITTEPLELIKKIIYPDDLEAVFTKVTERLKAPTDAGSITNEYRIIAKDGSITWVNDHQDFEYDPEGEPIFINGIVTNITRQKQINEKLETSLREKEILLKEVHHRTKNNLQVISSLIRLQSESVEDPEILDLFRETLNRLRAMGLIHEKIYQSKDLSKVEFVDYTRNLVNFLFRSYNVAEDTIKLRTNVENVALEIDTAIPCGIIANELVSNSLKHAFPAGRHGEIYIELSKTEDKKIILVYGDTGRGFPEGFDYHNTETLGIQMIFMLANQLNGTVEIENRPETAVGSDKSGCTFRITLEEPGSKKLV